MNKEEIFQKEISIPQAKALFHKGTCFDDEILLIDNIAEKDLPSERKESKCIVIMICEEGKIRFETNGETIFAEEKDILIISKGQYVDNYKVLSPMFRAKAIFIDNKDMPLLASIFCSIHELNQKLQNVNKVRLTNREMDNSEQIYLFAQNHISNKIYDKMHFAFAISFITILLHIALAKATSTTEEISKNEELYRKFTKIVRENLREHLSVSKYCAILGVSNSYLGKIVHKYANKSPKQYIQEELINHICIIAECTSPDKMSVKDIANWMNFPTQAEFSRFVQRHIKMSLSRFRNLKSDQQPYTIHHTILDQSSALADLPKIYIREDLDPLLCELQTYKCATCCS